MKVPFRQRLALWWHFNPTGPMILIAAVFALFLLAWLAMSIREPHSHVGYVTAQVIATAARPSDDDNMFYVTVVLDDMTRHRFVTGAVGLSGQVGDRICVKMRQTDQSGEVFAHAAPKDRCAF